MVNSLEQTLEFFAVITVELVLLFIGISFLVGLMLEYVPPERIRKLMGGDGWFGNVVGAAFGSITPFCSCSTIPLTMGFLEAKAPFGATMSFLLASPLLNPVILGMVLAFMGWEVALVYGTTTFILAVVVGRLWAKLGLAKEVKKVRVKGGRSDEEDGRPKYKRAASFAWENFVHMFPYLLIGVVIGALIYGVVPDDLIVDVAGPGNPLSVPAAAFIGIPLYVRAETIIPIGMALIDKGMGTGTVIALLIGGAGASIPEVSMLAGIFKRKLVIAFVLTIIAVAVTTGYLVDWLM
jgi:hypothetical protein